jgi:hypothetical protein
MIQICLCEECHHVWLANSCPDGTAPKRCAKCKSSLWDGRAGEEIEQERPVEAREEVAEEQIERELPAEDVPDSERTIARKMGHAIGCNCHSCERMREIFKAADNQQANSGTKAKTGGRAP